MIKKLRRRSTKPGFKRSLIISSGVMGIAAIATLSIAGLLQYTPNTSPAFPFIPPPADERYYLEITPEDLWNEFLSPYSDYYTAQRKYVGASFIFKNILIDENKLKWRRDTYIVIDLIKFVARDISELQELKEGNRIDIIGTCVGLSDKNAYIIVGNCQFFPSGIVAIPLPGGPAPISPSY